MRGTFFLLAMAAGPAPADGAFFEAKVRPLLAQHCFACHSARARKPRGRLLLDSRKGILAGGNTGPAAVPGRPERSLLLRAVGYGDQQLQMPPKGKLSAREVAVLTEWVRRGLPYPDAGADTSAK